MKLLSTLLLCAGIFYLAVGQNNPSATQKYATIVLNPKEIEAGKVLISQSDCKTCHVIEYTLIGPGYKEIARRYPLTENTMQYLSKKIISGGGGVWGENEMAAHQTLTLEQTRKIVQYILSLK